MSQRPFQPATVDHLVLRVADAARMASFYRDVIGCTVDREVPHLGLTHLRVGTAMIDLVSLDGKLGRAGGAAPGREGRNVDHFCITVQPFDEAAIRAHLAEQGVAVFAPGERYGATGEGFSFYIQDPEGNTIELKGA
ncbi:VOC family protein [Myxococcus sp. CA051A]|uniref:VOC family protein n=1 Tax=unclassified Myxococcus TaxID=2648731 RepID=UPI00157B5274|nr:MULTISPECIES: VOC family protein [unclassified Myxococcus]NTX17033.1 VOC family protein [Myxococcus sp. CA056]NTX63547.1 VOC family protein [Myxococcus sp. CA051A]